MILTVAIAGITAVSMITAVLIKPYIKIKGKEVGLYWIICLLGAITMIATERISLLSVFNGITAQSSVNPLKILTLFLSMTLLSVYLGDAGFFDYVADVVFAKSKGGQIKLFLILYFIVSILTVFTSNDIVILTFTPPVCIFAKKAKISPLPYLFGEFIAANTWSMALIVGNPTNIYLAGSYGINFLEYFSVMILPAVAGGLVALGTLLLIFRKQLPEPIYKSQTGFIQTHANSVKIYKTPMLIALFHLCLCIVLLALSDFIKVEMYIICLVLALSITVIDLIYGLKTVYSVQPVLKSLKKEPFELIPFVLSMFVIVLALKENGATDALGKALLTGTKWDGATFGALSALSANLLNNIPMSVLFEKIVSGQSLIAVYGCIIGSNVGAFFTPVGALAGIMWSKILKKYGVKMPFSKFVLYGSAVAFPTLLASVGALILVF